MGGWMFVWMMVVLKIPIAALLWLGWWSSKAPEPQEEEPARAAPAARGRRAAAPTPCRHRPRPAGSGRTRPRSAGPSRCGSVPHSVVLAFRFFFVIGPALAVWAVILAGIGFTRPEFPRGIG